MDIVTELGIGATFSLIIIKMVFDFVKGRKRNGDGDSKEIEKIKVMVYKIKDDVEDLHEWHNKEDDDGVKVWYVRRSLEDAISKLADNISRQTEVFAQFGSKLDNLKQ